MFGVHYCSMIVHGGVWDIPDNLVDVQLACCKKAANLKTEL